MFSYDAEILPQVRLIGHIKYREKWMHFSRCIDEYVAYIMVDGNMYLEEAGVQYHLRKHDMLILEPGLEHKGYQGAACDYYYIHFKSNGIAIVSKESEEALFEELVEKRKISLLSNNLEEGNSIDSITCLPKTFTLSSDRNYMAMLKSDVMKYYTRKEQYKRLTSANIHSFFLELSQDYLSAYLMKENENVTHVKKSSLVAENVLHYLNVNYSMKINSKMIEEKFEVNFDYLNRIFNAITGETIFQYLTKVRINQAEELIRTTNLPFGEIGYLVGIEDQFYFSKLFKKITGLTPTGYYHNFHQ